jgi:photosystem II stability/assembly factor-like uncharacterized protein
MKKNFTKILALLLLVSGSAQAQWAKQTSGTTSNLFGLKFYDENRGFVVGWAGANSDILRTTDGGKTWKKTSIPNTYLFSVDMRDTSSIYIGGYDFGCSCGLIKKSTDGGATWNTADDMHIPETFGLYNVILRGNGKGYASGYNGAILRTENNWSGYTLGNTNTSSEIFRVLKMAVGDTGYAGGGADFSFINHVYRTTNGTDWQLIKDYADNFSIGGIYFVNGKTGFLTGSDGMPAIMKTTDEGNNWTSKYKGTNSQLLVTDIAMADGRTGYAVTSGGELLGTSDGGETWKSEQKFSGEYLSAVYVVNQNVAYAVGENGVIVKRSGSTVIDQKKPEPEFGLQVFNGSNGEVRIAVDAPVSLSMNLQLTDMQGRLISGHLPTQIKGSQTFTLMGLQPGVYLVSASSERSLVSRKFVILR